MEIDYTALASRLKPAVNGPMRNEAVELKVKEQLRGLDSLLDIQWVPMAAFNSANEYEGRYGLICKWPSGDGRWKMYQSGEIGEPYDFIGWFCTDMQDASSIPVDLDSIEAKVVELLGKCDNTRYPWRERMGQLVHKNAKMRKDRQKEFIDQAGDVASILHQAAGRWDATKVERIMQEAAEENYGKQ